MEQEQLTVPCRISSKMFCEFAVFDAMRRRKSWLRPVVFAVFFVLLAALAYSRAGQTDGAAVLGGALLLVGLGLPAAYFGNFFYSVRKRARQLNPKEIAYTLTLTDTDVVVDKGGQHASYSWDRLLSAHRLHHSACIYVDQTHAFLLPNDSGDAAWHTIAAHLPSGKVTDHRR